MFDIPVGLHILCVLGCAITFSLSPQVHSGIDSILFCEGNLYHEDTVERFSIHAPWSARNWRCGLFQEGC